MGSCGTKLQEEHHVPSNILPTHKHISPKNKNKNKNKSITLKQSDTNEITSPNLSISNIKTSHIHTRKRSKSSTDSRLSSSFECRNDDITSIKSNKSEHTNSNINSQIIAPSNLQNEALIHLRFNRTLFCEDITYEYAMSCNLHNNIDDNDEIIPPWILRLTVEKLTKFYTETFEKYDTRTVSIPYQFGKVMKPKVFTELLNNILHQPGILKDENKYFSETTANFLNIPYDIRSIIQYDVNTFIHSNVMDCNIFKYFEIIQDNDEKYKYLCHSSSIYKHDYEYDDCCQCYDEPEIICYSYWVRSLKYEIDFLFTITSNNIFYIIMNDLSYNISQILINYGFDNNSAWIITDYLPKYLLFNHTNEQCNSQIIYKYDPRNIEQYNNEEDDDEEYASFLLEVMGNKLLQRHNITNIDEIHDMCSTLRIQHTSIPPALPEMSPSLSEYIISNSNHLSHQNQIETGSNQSKEHSVNNIWETPAHPSSDSIDFMEESILSSTITKQENCQVNEEKYRIFFSAFIDEEGEDDINLYQWILSLQKIGLNLSEKEIVSAFNYMLECNEDSEGYIDFVDFTSFCTCNIKANKQVKHTQELLNNFIKRN